MAKHREKIRLLGSEPATVTWWDGSEEGEISVAYEFLSYIHEHTRENAERKAADLAPDVSRWLFITGA